jgi:hypothetical protein
MTTTPPQPKVPQVVAEALKPECSQHDRQRSLVLASLLCR